MRSNLRQPRVTLLRSWGKAPAVAAFLVIFVCSEYGHAQQSSFVLRRPAGLEAYDPCIGPQPATRSKEYWRVWTDRDDVPAYADELLTAPARSTLKFLEPFYVVQVSNNKTAMLLIRSKSEPFADIIVPDGPLVGWVRVENLLLNASGARSENFIAKRIFITIPVAARAAPSLFAAPLRTIPSSDLFSYVYKYDQCGRSDWLLVGSKAGLTQFSDPHETMIGWIPRSRAAEWETGEAYEPVPDRKFPAHVFRTEASMRSNNLADLLFTDVPPDKWPLQKLRYVLLSRSSDGKGARIGYFDTSSAEESRTSQTFQAGWVRLADPEGVPLLRPVYLVSQDELLTSRNLLTEFGYSNGTGAGDLVKTWKNTVEQACGCRTDSPYHYLQMRSSLNFRTLGSFLRLSWDELSRARPEEIRNYLNLAKAAADRFDKLRSNDSIWFKSYGQLFAWIPAADLP